MFRYKHLLRPVQFVVIYGSALAFWYTYLPEHWLTLLAKMSGVMVGIMVMFILSSLIVHFIIKALYKRYKWARRVFMKP